MSKPDSSEDLAAIVRQGASNPLKKWIYIVIGLGLIGGGWAYYKSRDKEVAGGPEFLTEPLEPGDISIEVTATGTLAPINQVTVGSELSGTASEVYADTNDLVKKGQPLAKLDTTKLESQTDRSRAVLAAAKARVNQARATLTESEANHARLKELHKLSGGQTPSKAEMETSDATVARGLADLESANASVEQAQADLKSIERDLSKTIIRSPVDGTVLTRKLEVGQTVAASFTAPELFVIGEDLSKMELNVAVGEAEIGRIEAGQEAEFSVSAWRQRTYKASVKKVLFGSVVTNNVVTYSTELDVNNDDLSLRPGMTATAEIYVTRKENVLTVSNAALRFDPESAARLGQKADDSGGKTLVQQMSPFGGRRGGRIGRGNTGGPPSGGPDPKKGARIWVLEDGKPVEISVTTGVTDGNRTEVSGEQLKEGMAVIISAKPKTTT
ncbi:efflux RND transporter periplasmic adaptor subunit [Haloferula sp. BvORR071]|uniref:efflux RND transporter periplasmic adaptor subunit n=1 Tax=Haloferula sp. BvORR071 TaxID=1396141 RepID=UPI00054E803B|nr:efflux RND transporter periplasmic adaptor subunit [Haloferula sp. BvORR071]